MTIGDVDAALQPHDLWTTWEFDPGIVIPLVLTALLYARGSRPVRGVGRQHLASFWCGWILLAVALVSPLHPLGESLFSAHMAQHEILMLGAAPLMAFSRPLAPLLRGLPMSWRVHLGRWSKTDIVHNLWRALKHPFSAWSIHAGALWIWHAPRFFDATLTSDSIHALQHSSFFGSALLFWWSLFHAHTHDTGGGGILYIFTTAIHTSILGALLTLTSHLWYTGYTATTAAWGFTPLEDQQLGGLIMWVPAGLVYIAVGLKLLADWLREGEPAADETNARRYA
jgi:putative membrane protein